MDTLTLAIVAVVEALIAGGIIAAILKRRWDKRDRQDTETANRTIEQIRAESLTEGRLMGRIESLEQRIEELTSTQMSLREKNVELNLRLEQEKAENDRLRIEAEGLRERVRILETELKEIRETMMHFHDEGKQNDSRRER